MIDLFDIGYWMRRFLHHCWKHRFFPSIWYCLDCKAKWSGRPHHVQRNHEKKQPSHLVLRFDLKPRIPRPEEYRPRLARARKIPADIDFRPILKSVYEAGDLPSRQGKQGSCTAQCGLIDRILVALKLGVYAGLASAAYLYIRERLLHGWEKEDSGALMIDITAVFAQWGICLNKTMPYNENDYTTLPTAAADEEAKQWRFDAGDEALHVDQIADALYECQRNPHAGTVRFGIPCYSSYTKAIYNGGIVPVSDPNNEELLGYHAQACLGKLDTMGQGYYIHGQSWGPVGDLANPPFKGIFYYPYAEARQVEALGQLEARVQQDNQAHPSPQPPEPPKTCAEKYPNDFIRFILCLLGILKSTKKQRARVQAMINEVKPK